MKILLKNTYLLVRVALGSGPVRLTSEQVARIRQSEGHMPEEVRSSYGHRFAIYKEQRGLKPEWFICHKP